MLFIAAIGSNDDGDNTTAAACYFVLNKMLPCSFFPYCTTSK